MASILLVENQAAEREKLSALLVREGLKIEVAESGKMALDKLRDSAFDIALVDMKAPGTSTFSFFRELIEDYPHMATIALASPTGRGSAKALDAGVDDFLQQPVSDLRLQAAVRRCLQQRRLENELAQARQRISELESTGTDEALAAMAHKFRTIFDNANDEILYLDQWGTVLDVNDRVKDIFGFEREEVIGRNFAEFPFADTEALGQMAEEYADAVRSGGTIVREVAARRKDGTPVWVESSTRSALDPAGETIILTIVRDITERKQAEEALRSNERLFRILTERLWDGVSLISLDGSIGYEGPWIESILGYAPEERMGAGLMDLVHEQDVETCAGLFQDAVGNPGQVYRIDMRARHKDGSWHWIECSGRNLADEPDIGGILVSWRDITERKQAEEALLQRLRTEEMIATISSQFASTVDLDLATNTALRDVGELSGADRAYVFHLDEPGETISNTHEWSREGVTPQIEALQDVPCSMFPWWIEKMREDEIIHITDVFAMPPEAAAEKELVESQDIRSFVLIPLSVGGKWAGFIGLDNTAETSRWGDDIVLLLRTVAGIIGNGLTRKRAEEALQREKGYSDSIVDTAQTIILVLDTEGRIVRFNPCMEEISGYRFEEVAGKDWFATFLPERDRDSTQALFRTAIGDIQTRGNVNPILTKSGQEREIEWYDKTLKDADGNVIGLLSTGQDITDRRRAEEALARTNALLEGVLDAIPDIIGIQNPDHTIIRYNRAGYEILGMAQAEVAGRKCYELIGRDRVCENCATTKALITRRLEETERYVPEFGRHLLCRSKPILDEHGEVTLIVQQLHDITERKLAEQALRESEENFRDLVENLLDGVAIADENAYHIYVNPRFSEITGYSRDELLNMTGWDFTRPEDRARLQPQMKDRMAGKPYQAQYDRIILRKDGTELPTEMSTTVTTWRGKKRHMAIVRDITVRKQAEQALQLAEEQWETTFNAMPDSVCLVDASATVLQCNWATMGMVGKTRDAIIGHHCWEVMHGTSEPIAGCPVVRMKESLNRESLAIQIGDRWIEVIVDPVLNPTGELYGAVHIMRDITDRKLAEEALREDQEQLRSLASELELAGDRERREIAAELHDNVGQTLAVVKLRLGELGMTVAPEVAMRVKATGMLVDEAIAEARSLTGQLSPPALWELGLEAALESLCDQFTDQHGIQYRFVDKGGEKPLRDEARAALYRIVRELLMNTVKHARAQSATVTMARQGTEARITVEDDGIGFDPSPGPGGSRGFGLFSMRERLSHLGGSVQIESKPGQGTRVTLAVPLATDNPSREEA